MFALVERFRYFPGEDRVDGADDDQEDGIGERDHVRGVCVRWAYQEIVLSGGVVVHGPGRGDHHPHAVDQNLKIQFIK